MKKIKSLVLSALIITSLFSGVFVVSAETTTITGYVPVTRNTPISKITYGAQQNDGYFCDTDGFANSSDYSVGVIKVGNTKPEGKLLYTKDMTSDVYTGYPSLTAGAYGDRILEVNQTSSTSRIRLQKQTESMSLSKNDKVRVGIRVYIADVCNSTGTVDSTITSLSDTKAVRIGTEDLGWTGGTLYPNRWNNVYITYTLTAAKTGSLGITFGFGANSGAYASKIFVDDFITIEKTGNLDANFTNWSIVPDVTTGMAELRKNMDTNAGQVYLNTAGGYTALDGYAAQDSSATFVNTTALPSDVSAGLSTANSQIIKTTQTGNINMMRINNAVPANTFKKGQIVDVKFRVFLDDISAGALKTGETALTASDAGSLTGYISLRAGSSDVQRTAVQIPTNQWVEVTQRFRINADTDVRGIRFDMDGSCTKEEQYDTPFAATIYYDGTWSITAVTDVFNTYNHVLDADTKTISFDATAPATGSAKAIVALYNGNGFVGCKIFDVSSAETSYSHTFIEADLVFDSAKLFLFDNFTNLVPLQETSDF